MADTTARIRLALEGQGQVVQGLKQVEDGAASLKRSMAQLAGGLSVGATVGQLVKVQREFDVLNSSLITMTGSSAAAQREMAWIKQFAATTPYGLNEVTGAFVKMKALGLDPSQKALASYGNTASAMGKSLTQMIEAVADASTGEFERLKEFGIKAKKQGDDVSLTFRGVTKTIGNNSAEITAYLQRIGEVDFAGASVERAKTLDGAISNLGDSWDELFRTVNEGNVGGLISDSVRVASSVLGDASTIIRALNGDMRESARDAGVMASAQSAVATVFETVAVLGTNLKFVLVSVGRELGGIAAQAAQILQGNFAGAAAIRTQLVADAEAGRREVDATTARILNARRLAGIAATGVGMDEPRFARLLNPQASPAAGGGAGGGGGGRASQNSAAQKAEKEHAEWLLSMVRAEDEARQKMFSNRMDAHDKLLKAAQDAYAVDLASYTDAAADAKRRLTDMQQEAEAIAYAEANQVSMAQAVEFTTIARLKEKQVAMMGNEAAVIAIQQEIDTRRQLIDAIASNDVRDAAKKLREDQAAEWAKTWDQVSQSFTDALMAGGKSVKQYLKDLFRTLVLRPILAPIGAGMASLFGAPASAGQGGGSIMGTLNSLSGMLDNLATSSANFLSGATINAQAASAWTRAGDWLSTSSNSAMANAGSWMQGNPGGGQALGAAGNAFAALGIQKSLSGGYKTGASGLVDVATAIGGALFGPVAGVVGGLFNRAFGRKLKDSGLEGTFGGDAGFSGQNFEFYKGGWFRSDKTKYSAMDPGLQKAMAGQYQALEVQTRNMAGVLGLSAAALDGFTSKIKLSFKGLNEEQIKAKLTEAFTGVADEQARLLMGTMVRVMEPVFGRKGRLVGYTETWVWQANQYVREGESASEALRRLSGGLSLVNGVFDTLNTRLMQTSLVGGDAASKLVDAFGGGDAFTAAASAYNQAFYSESERTAIATRQLTEALAGLGIALPANRAAYRSLVEAQDLYTERGREAYAALLKLAPVFDQITTATQQMGRALEDEVRRLRGLLTTSSTNSVAALTSDFALTTAAARAGDAGALERLPAISQALESAAALQAVTAADLAVMRGQLAASLQATMAAIQPAAGAPAQPISEEMTRLAGWAKSLAGGFAQSIPRFAAGGLHAGGVRLVGENGPELEVTGPARIYNAADTARMMGGNTARLEAQLDRLTAELEGLRAEVRAGVGHGATTAQILKRVTPNGTALATEAAA